MNLWDTCSRRTLHKSVLAPTFFPINQWSDMCFRFNQGRHSFRRIHTPQKIYVAHDKLTFYLCLIICGFPYIMVHLINVCILIKSVCLLFLLSRHYLKSRKFLNIWILHFITWSIWSYHLNVRNHLYLILSENTC